MSDPTHSDLAPRLDRIETILVEIHQLLSGRPAEKDWYTTDEVAEALDKAEYTVREKWCNAQRIEATKDPETGRWKIPGHELRRLVNGGGLRPARKYLGPGGQSTR